MKRVPALIPVLALASAVFIGILIWAYIETRKANPQMLDEQGRVRSSQVTGARGRGPGAGASALQNGARPFLRGKSQPDQASSVPSPGPWPLTPGPQIGPRS